MIKMGGPKRNTFLPNITSKHQNQTYYVYPVFGDWYKQVKINSRSYLSKWRSKSQDSKRALESPIITVLNYSETTHAISNIYRLNFVHSKIVLLPSMFIRWRLRFVLACSFIGMLVLALVHGLENCLFMKMTFAFYSAVLIHMHRNLLICLKLKKG